MLNCAKLQKWTFSIKIKGMHQPMKTYGKKLLSLWEKVDFINPCKHLVSPNSNPNINFFLNKLSNIPSLTPTNSIHCLVKKRKRFLILLWLNPPNYPLLYNSSIIIETISPLKYSLTCQINSILYKLITWGDMTVKKDILSVASSICLTFDIERILLGRFKNHIE